MVSSDVCSEVHLVSARRERRTAVGEGLGKEMCKSRAALGETERKGRNEGGRKKSQETEQAELRSRPGSDDPGWESQGCPEVVARKHGSKT